LLLQTLAEIFWDSVGERRSRRRRRRRRRRRGGVPQLSRRIKT